MCGKKHDFCGKINIFSVKSSFLQEKLAKELISRKMWSRFLILFYTAQSDFYRNSLSHFFGKNFVKPILLLNKLLNCCWIDVRVSFSFYYARNVEKREIISHWKKFRENNSLVTSLVKTTLLTRNFCQKCVRVNFWNSTLCKVYEIFVSSLEYHFVKSILQ